MLEHIKGLEKGKADAEEEIRNLKISFVTQKAEGEEEMTRLRMKMKADYDQMVANYTEQVETFKHQIEKLETELQRQSSILRKAESENSTLIRQNENLRQQMNQLDMVRLRIKYKIQFENSKCVKSIQTQGTCI